MGEVLPFLVQRLLSDDDMTRLVSATYLDLVGREVVAKMAFAQLVVQKKLGDRHIGVFLFHMVLKAWELAWEEMLKKKTGLDTARSTDMAHLGTLESVSGSKLYEPVAILAWLQHREGLAYQMISEFLC